MIKSIIVFTLGMTGIIIIKFFFRIILLNFSLFSKGICINNTLFLWHTTSDNSSLTSFNCLCTIPRMLSYTNTNNQWCKYTCCKNNNLCTRKWILWCHKLLLPSLMSFLFQINPFFIKGTVLAIKFSILSPKKSILKCNSSSYKLKKIKISFLTYFLWSVSKLSLASLLMWGITQNIHPVTENPVLVYNSLFSQ